MCGGVMVVVVVGEGSRAVCLVVGCGGGAEGWDPGEGPEEAQSAYRRRRRMRVRVREVAHTVEEEVEVQRLIDLELLVEGGGLGLGMP